ncbi:hypothetical protein BY996DRAFT_8394071 [Phakopsora pachyrhizi]|uniref:Uncharacterized protein n=1 Tax=Phakopsora pachyrhizi TaxID=170000 RepID=A0AAV0AQB4_PHAPC|nr:hypothetical protein BY996DRAFT_8394071 [Phakopsora pachyrhizi]CAH7671375.1 hypothetical protein PPACK8108_LOCUS6149 [Phakopsora pachyrhizi]
MNMEGGRNGQVWSWGINDNPALGRKTKGIEGVEQEELESCPIKVEKLSEDNQSIFRAVRVEAGDSVSVAVSNQEPAGTEDNCKLLCDAKDLIPLATQATGYSLLEKAIRIE